MREKKTTNIPLVSIIMNCHNGEDYLFYSLKSIINQTYKNWELIFFDNCSRDQSKKIFKKFNDKRFKYYNSKKKLKLYHARYLAVKKCRGKFICFLDTDDYWENTKIESQLIFMDENPEYSIVYSNYYIFDEKKNKQFLRYNHFLPDGNITKKILKNYTIGILTVLIKKEVFKKFNFNSDLSILGDFDFFVKISENFKIGCIQKPLATYRVHNNNYSKRNIKEYIFELQNWINENSIPLKKKGVNLFYQKYLLLKLKIKNLLL